MKISKLKFVIDTNIILVSVAPYNKFHWVFELIENGIIELCISNEILLEYQEKIGQLFDADQAETTVDFLITEKSVRFIHPFYFWNLITVDPDDNKFVDCYLAADADYLVTNDKHFNVLKGLDFPKVNVIRIDELKELISNEPTK